MAAPVTFETFQQELASLVARFDREHAHFTNPDYNEAMVREDFLNPFFRALGWDVGNSKGLIHTEREVDIEVRTALSGKQTRADYVFRVARVERFTCEAKKPAETLHAGHIYQAKRDAFARGIPIAVLSDFEELKIYIVGARPRLSEPHVGEYKKLHFREYLAAARELWDLLAYERVAAGAIDQLIDSLPKRALKLRGRQGYLIKPDRTKSLDADFLNFLDEARRALGSDLLKYNDREDLLTGHRLNEAAQRIIDRLVFLRICEDRGIDTGGLLDSLLTGWVRDQRKEFKFRREAAQSRLAIQDKGVHEDPGAYGASRAQPPEGSLYRELVEHVRSLDQRPPSYKPFFNGQLFKPHFSEELTVGDDFLANFIDELTDDDSGYNFADIKVEILGSAYERFLGNVLLPQGRGVKIEEKPEVRKAGGVYYTPRYIVDYIVEQTVARQLAGKSPKEVAKLRFLDPACGSGSFLLRVYERVMEHYLRWFMDNPSKQTKADCYLDAAGNVRLTTQFKRRILQENVYGVDIDAQAVEVTQLSLYLKMLEGENRESIRAQTELFSKEPLLPALDKNILCGNSLIASDFSLDADELVRVNAFNWNVQFSNIMKSGGFDAVVGNPPYLYSAGQESSSYFQEHYRFSEYQTDFYTYFIEKALSLTRTKGFFSFVVSDSWLKAANFSNLRSHLLSEHLLVRLAVFSFAPFEGATIENSILVLNKDGKPLPIPVDLFDKPARFYQINEVEPASALSRGLIDPRSSTAANNLIVKIETGSEPLDNFVDINRGIHAYRTDGYGRSKFSKGPQTKRDKDEQSYHALSALDPTYLPELKGKDVFRFEHKPTGNFLSYGEWLAEPREPKYFLRPRITLRKVLGRKLHGTFLATPQALDQSLYVLVSDEDDLEKLKFLLGILLSTIGAWYLRTKFAIYDTLYPWYTRKQLGAFPIKGENLKLVAMVDKMLALAPKLRAATGDQERATLLNAITATDREIDQLVYKLYGLTPEEIALVEGTAETPAEAAE